ncbi:hypothetical protein Tco_0267328 [Tanacetum coccineum]
MDAPTIPVSIDSSEGNFRDVPAAADAFPAVTIVAILASLGEVIRGIHEYLQGVPVEEDMSTLRFRMSMIEEENASLRGKIRTMEAIEMVTRKEEDSLRAPDVWSLQSTDFNTSVDVCQMIPKKRFSKDRQPMTKLTQKKVQVCLGAKNRTASQLLKAELCMHQSLHYLRSEDSSHTARFKEGKALVMPKKNRRYSLSPGKANVVDDALIMKEREPTVKSSKP